MIDIGGCGLNFNALCVVCVQTMTEKSTDYDVSLTTDASTHLCKCYSVILSDVSISAAAFALSHNACCGIDLRSTNHRARLHGDTPPDRCAQQCAHLNASSCF